MDKKMTPKVSTFGMVPPPVPGLVARWAAAAIAFAPYAVAAGLLAFATFGGK